jgi:hypothetical protein
MKGRAKKESGEREAVVLIARTSGKHLYPCRHGWKTPAPAKGRAEKECGECMVDRGGQSEIRMDTYDIAAG